MWAMPQGPGRCCAHMRNGDSGLKSVQFVCGWRDYTAWTTK